MSPVRLPKSFGPKRHKYRAKPTMVDGLRFDSQKEARRWRELQLLERGGEIKELEPHPKFPLYVPTHGAPHVFQQIGVFTPDFRYRDRDGRVVVEDVKAPVTKTTAYRLRKRMAEAIYGIQVQEV